MTTLTFVEAARLALMGCKDMPAEAAEGILRDCKMALDMEDAFGFMEDAQRVGQKHLNGYRGRDGRPLVAYTVFRDFNEPMSKLQISIALNGSKGVKAKPTSMPVKPKIMFRENFELGKVIVFADGEEVHRDDNYRGAVMWTQDMYQMRDDEFDPIYKDAYDKGEGVTDEPLAPKPYQHETNGGYITLADIMRGKREGRDIVAEAKAKEAEAAKPVAPASAEPELVRLYDVGIGEFVLAADSVKDLAKQAKAKKLSGMIYGSAGPIGYYEPATGAKMY